MKSYLVDEISPSDIKKINEFLDRNAIQSPLEKLYWIQLPANLLSDIQSQHTLCQPHAFSIELGHDRIKVEFLIRSSKNMSCLCQAYCTPRQRNFILGLIDNMITDLSIRT